MTKPRLVKVRALFYVIKHVEKSAAGKSFDPQTASFSSRVVILHFDTPLFVAGSRIELETSGL